MNPMRLFELYIEEDCPYFDETAELIGINGEGRLEIIPREPGVSACTEELAEFYRSRNLRICGFVPSGSSFEAGWPIISVEGDLRELFKVWRVSQTLLSITCAIATETRKLVGLAKKTNPDVIVATTRKTHPGMRYFELKAVRAGGGEIHRNSLSDSILITQNHLNVAEELPRFRNLRRVEVEPRTAEEAVELAGKADLILLDHFSLEELRELIPTLRKLNSSLEIAVAGNINARNIAGYAEIADVIVTSAPYYARPLDLTTRIERG